MSTVYVLNADINLGELDQYGITSVHATIDGALARLDAWLTELGIDLDAAHYGQMRADHGAWNDPDPDTTDGEELTWGVNRMDVLA